MFYKARSKASRSTYEENGLGGRLAVDLLQELGLEGDHADKAVDRHQVGEDHHGEDAVAEEAPQRRNEVWWWENNAEAN